MITRAFIKSILLLSLLGYITHRAHSFTSLSSISKFQNKKSIHLTYFNNHHQQQNQRRICHLFAEKNPSPKSKSQNTAVIEEEEEEKEEEEDTADVYGAEFFGGASKKEEYFDIEVENRAEKVFEQKLRVKKSNDDPLIQSKLDFIEGADEDSLARKWMEKLQTEINQVLKRKKSKKGKKGKKVEKEKVVDYESQCYSPDVIWETPLDVKASSPIKELQAIKDFYSTIALSIVSAKTLSSANQLQIQWEFSVNWPNAWEAQVFIPGSSILTLSLDNSRITSQKDSLKQPLLANLATQLIPRFWDLYHIGMTPSAELIPKVPPTSSTQSKSFFASYDIQEIPSRLVYKPTLIDASGRMERQAQALPNHAFTTIIRTAGTKKHKFVPTSPVEVSLERIQGEKKNRITWTLGVPPRLSSLLDLPLPVVEDPEGDTPEGAAAVYEYQSRRRVATIPFGGSPQDVDVDKVRKKLYEEVVRDGWRVKCSKNTERPMFFFWSNDVKACFTEKGLGMAVYVWSPKWAKCNSVGIELEMD